MATIGVYRRCGNLFVDVKYIEVAKRSRWYVFGHVSGVGWFYLFLTIRSLFNFMLSVVDFNLEAKSRTWGGNV